MPKKKKEIAEKYTVVKGFNVPDGKGGEKRWEIGDTFKPSDVSEESLNALLSRGDCLEEKNGTS